MPSMVDGYHAFALYTTTVAHLEIRTPHEDGVKGNDASVGETRRNLMGTEATIFALCTDKVHTRVSLLSNLFYDKRGPLHTCPKCTLGVDAECAPMFALPETILRRMLVQTQVYVPRILPEGRIVRMDVGRERRNERGAKCVMLIRGKVHRRIGEARKSGPPELLGIVTYNAGEERAQETSLTLAHVDVIALCWH